MSDKPKWTDLFGMDPDYNKEELERERAKLFEVFKAGWMAAAKAVEGELNDRGRGWNDHSGDNPILIGMREGLQTAVNTIRDGHQPSWRPRGRHDVQEAFDHWLQEQVDEVDVLMLDKQERDTPKLDELMSEQPAWSKSMLHKDPWVMRRIGKALDAIRYADREGLETELDLLAFAEDVLDHERERDA